MSVEFTAHAEPIAGYKLIEPLGRGGFGEVWKAEAPGGLLKAIKLVYGSLRSGAGEEVMVQQELKALHCVKGVRHPYILALDRFDIIDGQLVIVMELADQSLWDRFQEYVARGAAGIARGELLRLLEETAEALDLMNIRYKLQHSDIKPQNLFLVHNHIKIADFGLVKDLKGMKAMTSGCFSPLYSAPETFEGWVSPHSDQYSLAIVYQELLTGIRPFDGKNARQLLMQHMQAQPNLSPLPGGDRDIIGRALAKKPDQRFTNCTALVQALRRSLHTQVAIGPVEAAPVTLAFDKPALPDKPLGGAPNLQPSGPQSGVYHLTFAIRCPSCGYTGRVPKKFRGQTVKCRECAQVFQAEPTANAGGDRSASPAPAPTVAAPAARPTPPPVPAPTAPKPPAAVPAASMAAPRPATPTVPLPTATTAPKPPAPPIAASVTAVAPIKPPTPSVPVPAATAPATRPAVPAAVRPAAAMPTPGATAPRPPAPAVAVPAAIDAPIRLDEPISLPGPSAKVPSATNPLPTPVKPADKTPMPAPPRNGAPTTAIASAPPPSVVVECPVCGHTRHAPAPNQAGSLRCQQCGCVHGSTSDDDSSAPTPAAVVAASSPLPFAAPLVPIDCPVCGFQEQVLADPQGSSIKCRRCGCVHRSG